MKIIKKFETEYSYTEFTERLKCRVNSSLITNWQRDCIVGKVSKRSFYYYFHKAYIRNSFNKYLYGRISEKDGVTVIKTIILSPFLSLQVHIKLLIFSSIFNLLKFDINTYFSNIISAYFVFGTFCIIIGGISQIIPISDEKRKLLYGVMEESLTLEVKVNSNINLRKLDKTD